MAAFTFERGCSDKNTKEPEKVGWHLYKSDPNRMLKHGHIYRV